MFVLVLHVQPVNIQAMSAVMAKRDMRYYTEIRGCYSSHKCCSFITTALRMLPQLQLLGLSLKSVPGVRAVASWRPSIAVRLVRVLIKVLVVLLHQRRVVPAVLRA